MADSVAGVVLAAGAGTRLAPLTRLRPKALCPVDNVALVDHAIDAAARPATGAIAVNVHHGLRADGAAPARTTGPRCTCRSSGTGRSAPPAPSACCASGSTAGRVLVTNADAWLPVDLGAFVDGWDGERIRLLVVEDRARPDFGSARYCGVALLPWSDVAGLDRSRRASTR